jgi:hypothetical protein
VLIQAFKDGKLLCRADLMIILTSVSPMLQEMPNIVHVDLQVSVFVVKVVFMRMRVCRYVPLYTHM